MMNINAAAALAALTTVPVPEQATVEQAIAFIDKTRQARNGVSSAKVPKLTSRLCRCGKRISYNAQACRRCMLDAIDAALVGIEKKMGESAGRGEFAAANEASQAITRLVALREEVYKAHGTKAIPVTV